MTLTVGLRFPWGRFHATPWGRHVNEGVPEWPPSPWRLTRAFYAIWKNRVPYLNDELVEGVLDKLTGAPEYQLPPHVEFHTRHYMPDPDYKDEVHGSPVLDPFVVVAGDAEILMRWDGELTGEEARCLSMLADHLTYLGRAESLCVARLLQGSSEPDNRWTKPANGDLPLGGAVSVLVSTTPIDLEGLIQRPWRLRAKGHIEPPGSERVDYPRPAPVLPTVPSQVVRRPTATVVRFVLAGSARPSRRAAVAVSHVLRQAAMSRLGRRDGRKSATLAGKDSLSQPLALQHGHAHYLAFTTGTDPRITNVAVWAPGGLDTEELAALTSLKDLRPPAAIPDVQPCKIGLEAFGDAKDVIPELTGPALRWRSFTPFAPTRHSQKKDLLKFLTDEVTRELNFRGIPAPAEVELLRGDWLSYRRHRPSGHQRLTDAHRAFGLALTFADAVTGPIAIGGLSHFGLGLFLPDG